MTQHGPSAPRPTVAAPGDPKGRAEEWGRQAHGLRSAPVGPTQGRPPPGSTAAASPHSPSCPTRSATSASAFAAVSSLPLRPPRAASDARREQPPALPPSRPCLGPPQGGGAVQGAATPPCPPGRGFFGPRGVARAVTAACPHAGKTQAIWYHPGPQQRLS